MALIRGINVGKAKRVSMADLRALLESIGYENVATLQISGNAVFTTGGTDAGALEEKISAGMLSDIGIEAKVLVRTVPELDAVSAKNPFVPKKIDPKELHVAFLSDAAPAKLIAGLDRSGFAPDEFAVGDRVIYTRQPNGVMGTNLPGWEKVLGLDVTQRTWNTVLKLRDLAART